MIHSLLPIIKLPTLNKNKNLKIEHKVILLTNKRNNNND